MTAVHSLGFLEEVVNTMTEGLTVIGPDGRIVRVNPALERLTGYERSELLGKPCSVLNCDACERSRKEGRQHWCRLFDDRKVHRRRCLIMRKDGSYVPVLKNATLLRDGQGNVQAAVETLTDISEIEQRDRKIEELSKRLEPVAGFYGMIGKSPAALQMFRMIERAAASDAPVIIFGESGTGKELAARALHEIGPRREKPFIQLNCAALNEALLESELFGHVKGAFTGAIAHRQGRFEAADEGDLFLDEIGDMPLSTQVKLLRVLETKLIERVGDHRPIKVDVRIISATNKDLRALIARGEFREDFFFRINVIPINLPPLRNRKEDIPLLTDCFLDVIMAKSGHDIHGLGQETLELFQRYDWPGNVRELRSALEYAVVHAEGGCIEPVHLPREIRELERPRTCSGRKAFSERTPCSYTADFSDQASEPPEKRALVHALRQAKGNQSKAARILGVHRGTVINRMRKYGVNLERSIKD